MSEYIHQDDAYEWLRDKEIVFAEQDFAKVQAERDQWRKVAELLYQQVGHDSHCESWWDTKTHIGCECGAGEGLEAYEKAARND